jgi:hypothetical protein
VGLDYGALHGEDAIILWSASQVGLTDPAGREDTAINTQAYRIKLTGMDPIMPPDKDTINKTKSESAYQSAIEYGIDVYQLEYLLTLTPAERLMRHDAALALVLAAREAGIRYYGFDPSQNFTPAIYGWREILARYTEAT